MELGTTFTGLMIMVRHRTFSRHLQGFPASCSHDQKMSTHTAWIQLRKQSVTNSDSVTTNESSDSEPLKKKRTETVEKWIRKNEKTLQMTA